MKRTMKVLITLVVCLVLAFILFMLSLNTIVGAAIGKVGTAVLGTQTSVKSVSISLLGGKAEIKGLTIANPAGYGDGNVIELGGIRVGLKPASLLSDTVVVSEIIIDSPSLKLKQQGLNSNLQVVLKNAGGGEEKKPAEEQKPAPKKAESAGKKFKVELIRVTNGHLEYALGAAPAVRVPLPNIELKNISNADGSPVMLKDIFVQVISEMTKAAASAVGGEVKDVLNGAADAGSKALNKAAEGVKGAAKGVESFFKDLGGKTTKK